MKPYSVDLRKKIVTLYQRKEGSIRQLAKRFQVSPDFVRRLLKQERETGSITPKPYNRGSKARLNATHHAVLKQLVAADDKATLQQLAARLQEKTQVQVSSSTISRTLTKLGMLRTKKGLRKAKSIAARSHKNNRVIKD